VTANTVFQGQRVKGQGHSVRNKQHRFNAKSVGLSYLFNLSGGRGHDHVSCHAEVHKTSENTIFSNHKTPKNPENPHNTPERLVRYRSDFEMQCFRNCTLSSCSCTVRMRSTSAFCYHITATGTVDDCSECSRPFVLSTTTQTNTLNTDEVYCLGDHVNIRTI